MKVSTKVNTSENVVEEEFTKEETANQLLASEDDIIKGILEAGTITEEVIRQIDIKRREKVLFSFRVRPIDDIEREKCKKAATKFKRNKRNGLSLPESSNDAQYRSLLIYTATLDEDKEKIWDNQKVWKAFSAQGKQIVTAVDLIDTVIPIGTKERVLDVIEEISGYGDEQEEDDDLLKN